MEAGKEEEDEDDIFHKKWEASKGNEEEQIALLNVVNFNFSLFLGI